MGLLSHRTSRLRPCRHRRGWRRRRAVCGVGRRTAFLRRLSAAGQRHVRRPDYSNRPPPYFVLIDRALRDEGADYHYLASSTFAEAPDAALVARVEEIIGAQASIALHRGATWTTDAPYRETASAIERARQLAVLAVARSVENANHQRALQGWVAALLPPASSRLLTKSDGFQ
jgi:Phosphorylase superfamily